jgi:hypothetical protein
LPSANINLLLIAKTQLHGHGRWFSPGTRTSSTTKTSRHDIGEILLEVALSTINQSTSINHNKIDEAEHRFNRETYSPSPTCHAVLMIGLYELLGNPTT